MRIDVRGVSVVIEDNHIIGGADLTVAPGTVTGLIGPNGSGKSTLLRCVYRTLRPVAGTVHIGSDDVWPSSARAAGKHTAVVTQDHDLDNDFSVEETAYCDQLVLLHNGKVVASGTPEDVLTADRVADVFGVRSTIIPHPITGRPHFVTAPTS
jgi:ABC-type cobalamin/Fe3+-siderophores transport system ATPase subunit